MPLKVIEVPAVKVILLASTRLKVPIVPFTIPLGLAVTKLDALPKFTVMAVLPLPLTT